MRWLLLFLEHRQRRQRKTFQRQQHRRFMTSPVLMYRNCSTFSTQLSNRDASTRQWRSSNLSVSRHRTSHLSVHTFAVPRFLTVPTVSVPRLTRSATSSSTFLWTWVQAVQQAILTTSSLQTYSLCGSTQTSSVHGTTDSSRLQVLGSMRHTATEQTS